MKTFFSIIGILAVIAVGYLIISKPNGQMETKNKQGAKMKASVDVIPIMHATAVLKWSGTVIYTDPTGGDEAFQGQSAADIILVTDIHSDHLSTSTLSAVLATSTSLIVPQAVKDLLPPELASRAKVLANGETISEKGFNILAMPMYNLSESPDPFHPKGRGNGYLITGDNTRVYIAGDTDGIPEMRALTDIDVALIPMNSPYTMTVEEAADAVLAFKPMKVYPYHYRGQDGLSDVNKFKDLVHAGNINIYVGLLDWYPKK